MPWVFHDSYKTQVQAAKSGKDIINLGLARGVKISPLGKKGKKFMLYILPLTKDRKEK